jgi:hypothetical protein
MTLRGTSISGWIESVSALTIRSAGLGSGAGRRAAWNIRNMSRRFTPRVPCRMIWLCIGRTP